MASTYQHPIVDWKRYFNGAASMVLLMILELEGDRNTCSGRSDPRRGVTSKLRRFEGSSTFGLPCMLFLALVGAFLLFVKTFP